MSRVAPPLAPELLAGLRRLKLATIRAQAPEVLQTARTQRWRPEDVLRTLVMAEISAREHTNQRLRLKAAANLLVLKHLDDFDTLASGITPATFAHLLGLLHLLVSMTEESRIKDVLRHRALSQCGPSGVLIPANLS